MTETSDLQTVDRIVDELSKLGLRLDTDGVHLRVCSPASVKAELPVHLVEALKVHKAEIIHWLQKPLCPGWGAVPPSNLPLNPVCPKPTPEQWRLVIGYLIRQTGGEPCPLAEWLGRRECAYYDGPGKHWDDAAICYAAARDAATWQLRRSECETLQTLAAFEQAAATHPPTRKAQRE